MRELQTTDRLIGRTGAHRALAPFLLALVVLTGCQSDAVDDETAAETPAATTAAAPESPAAAPLEQSLARIRQASSQSDAPWGPMPKEPLPDCEFRDRQTELLPTAVSESQISTAETVPSSEQVFAVSAEDAPRLTRVVDAAVVPADNPSAPESSPSDVNAPALLPWGPSTPSPELDAVNQRAEQVVRRAFNLAQRGALYSAQFQFAEALRAIAEALDLQRNTNAHTRALAAGLRALDEADDFVPPDARSQAEMNLQLIVDAHHTPVLKNRSLENVSLAAAQRMYLTYAQEQLAAAGGDQSVASLALHGMGKVCTAPAAMHGPRGKLDEAKAVVFYQSALIIDAQNFMAANELGVLLTKFGRWDDARSALEHSVAAAGTPTSWRNLAAVCEYLGDSRKAAEARQQADLAVAQLQKVGHQTPESKYAIEMVEPETFAQMHSSLRDATNESTVARPTAGAPPQQPPLSTAAKPNDKTGFWPWSRK